LAPTPPTADSPLAHDISEHRRQPGLAPATPVDLAGLPPGGLLRTLRRLADGRLRSGLLDLPAGWRCDAPLRATGVLQLFVLDGNLEADGAALGRYGYVVVPRGAVLPRLASIAATRLVLILDADTRLEPAASGASAASARVITDSLTVIEPIVPVIAGRRLEGFERRVLWLDGTSGADTRLLRIPAGFEGGGPGWHPVEEEILLLEGDVAPDDTRLLQPGDYLWNPARSVHGFHEHSRTGCLLLEWHDGPWAYNAWHAPGAIMPR
jgi:hypothetical protein